MFIKEVIQILSIYIYTNILIIQHHGYRWRSLNNKIRMQRHKDMPNCVHACVYYKVDLFNNNTNK